MSAVEVVQFSEADLWRPRVPDGHVPDVILGNDPVSEMLRVMSRYLILGETDHILAVLAAAAVSCVQDEEDPLWLLLIAPSSGGKGETLSLIADVANERVNDLTRAGLLSATKGASPVPTGLLAQYGGAPALFTVTDWSSMLDDPRSSGEAKSELYAALRDIYDGSYKRDMFGASVSWSGRLSLIGACTPAIDRFARYSSALGSRFVYYRMNEEDTGGKRSMARMVSMRSGLREERIEARRLAAEIVGDARDRLAAGAVSIPHSFDAVIGDAALLVTFGRGVVPRDYRGEIDDVVSMEAPGRVVGQLRMMALGLRALGLDTEIVHRIVRWTALSSMPEGRRVVLEVVAGSESPVTPSAVVAATGMDFRVAKRTLEDWRALGVVTESEGHQGAGGLASTDFAIAPDHEWVREVVGVETLES